MDTDSIAVDQWITRRDPEAFRVLVMRYSGMVYATCHRVLGNTMGAEDATQESFQALAMLQYPPKGCLGPWLHRVAVNKSLNLLRTEVRRAKRDQAYAAENGPVETTWDDLYEYVDEAIAKLPEKYRAPVIRHFLQGETQEAIAQSMHITRQTVAYRVQRGLEGIRKSLSRRGVIASAATLSALLLVHAVEAAPLGLLEKLGHLALLGPNLPAASASRLPQFLTRPISIKAVLVTVGIIITVVLGAKFLHEHEYTKPAHTPKVSMQARQSPPPAEAAPPPYVAPIFEAVASAPTQVAPVLPETAPNLGGIRGVLLDAQGKGQAAVEVVLKRTQAVRWADLTETLLEWRTTTDAEGGFSFSDLPVCEGALLRGWQSYKLSAEKDGLRAESDDLQVPFWDLGRFQELVLEPVAFVECRVTNEQGAPVGGGSVSLWDTTEFFRNRPAITGLHLGVDGTVQAGPLYAGMYQLQVRADGYAKYEQPLSHDAGMVQVILKKAPAIMGRIIDGETQNPLKDIKVKANAMDGRQEIRVISNADGSFAIPAKDKQVLMVFARAGKKCLRDGPLRLEQAALSGKELTLELAPGGTISGRALDPITGQGAPNISVCFSVNPIGFLAATHTDASGAYLLEGVCGKGEVQMLDWGNPGCAQALEVSPGQVIDHLDFVLSKNSRIAGRVTTLQNTPVENVLVAATPISPYDKQKRVKALTYMPFNTDGAGSITDTEGRFVLYCPGNSLEIYLQAFGRDLASQRVGPLTIPDNGLEGLVLRVEPTGNLTGCVLDAQSRPLSRANVQIQPLDPARGSMRFEREFATGMLGRYPSCGFRHTLFGDFSFDALLPGKYRVMVFLNTSSPEAPIDVKEVTITPGASEEIRLQARVDGLSTLQGVVSAQGRPQPNMLVEVLGGGSVEELVTTTDKNGYYKFDHLTGSQLWLHVCRPVNKDSLVEARTALLPGKATTLNIEIPVGTGRVEGLVTKDGTPAEGFTVWLTPFETNEGPSMTAITDAGGRYAFEGIVAGIFVLGVNKQGGQDKMLQQTLVSVENNKRVNHDFSLGGGAISVTMAGIGENERGHVLILSGEVIVESVSEESLVAMAPRAVKYAKITGKNELPAFEGLAPGIYTVYGAVHPPESEETPDVLEKARIQYDVVEVRNGAPVPVAFDFGPPQ